MNRPEKQGSIQPDSKVALEMEAKRRGVTLVRPSNARQAPAPTPTPRGFMARSMPVAAAMMAELRAQIDPKIWKAAMENLKAGRGYVVDETTNIAVGNPPASFERGRTEQREGFTIMRVKPKR